MFKMHFKILVTTLGPGSFRQVKVKNLAFQLTIPTVYSWVVFLSENSMMKQRNWRMLKSWLYLKERVHCSFCSSLFQY